MGKRTKTFTSYITCVQVVAFLLVLCERILMVYSKKSLGLMAMDCSEIITYKLFKMNYSSVKVHCLWSGSFSSLSRIVLPREAFVALSSHPKIQLWGPYNSLYKCTLPKPVSDAVILCALIEDVFGVSGPLKGSYIESPRPVSDLRYLGVDWKTKARNRKQ